MLSSNYTVLSTKAFQRRLDAAVTVFQAHCVPPTHDVDAGIYFHSRKIYEIVRDASEPLDYRQVTAALIATDIGPVGLAAINETILRRVHSRLCSLVLSGWLELCGTRRDDYFTQANRTRGLYRAVANPVYAMRAKARLDIEVDGLDQRYYQMRAKLVTPVLWATHKPNERDLAILKLRMEGKTLEEIGQEQTPPITRERVRQIIARAQS